MEGWTRYENWLDSTIGPLQLFCRENIDSWSDGWCKFNSPLLLLFLLMTWEKTAHNNLHWASCNQQTS
uniref:Uncharacterized protein n=1 Tax=Rhizophora mucronata TaxID=61149 RepID=A0A2P2K3D3_RHIMU